MRFVYLSYTALLALASTVYATGLQSASLKSHLQVAPSFAGDGSTLHPALHPYHNSSDLSHLIPTLSNELHWSQEGHRPALHGAKHGHLTATFNRPTVVLEHSNQVANVNCQDEKVLTVCFNARQAMQIVQQSWSIHTDTTFYLVTYHVGCGDETGTKRSFFEASHPIFNLTSSYVTVPITLIEEQDALDSGELSWGTYVSPHEMKRTPVKGHVPLSAPDSTLSNRTGYNATVDLTTNAQALQAFFNNLILIPANQIIWRMGWILSTMMGSWSVVILDKFFKKAVKIVVAVAKIIIKLAETTIDLIAVVFGHPFQRTYHEDIRIDYWVEGTATSKPPKILGIGNGFSLAQIGAFSTIECAKCGVEGNITIDGQLAFSIKDGLTKGEVSFINADPFNIHAIFGIKLEGKIPQNVPKISEQLKDFQLNPLAIPGIFNLGPQVTISAALSLALKGQIELLLGGTVSISPGTARLSLVDKTRNTLTGFTPSFHPVAEASSGSLTATVDLGLPIGLEVGLNVLNGHFKKTIGLIDAPSVYFTAQYSKGQNHTCQGVELRLGAKNRLYLSILGQIDYDLWDQKIYETGLTCITTEGFNKSAVEDDVNIFKEIQASFKNKGGLAADAKPTLEDLAANLTTTPKGNEGFRIVMDSGETSIMVSGEDGYVYMVDKKTGYDLSAPWGTLNMKKNALTFDVFGRLLNVYSGGFHRTGATMLALRALAPQKMPKFHHAAAVNDLLTSKEDFDVYGASMSMPTGMRRSTNFFYYPTACKVPNNGLRLYLTKYLITKDGTARNRYGDDFTSKMQKGLKYHGLKIEDCRTVRLTSTIKGTTDKK